MVPGSFTAYCLGFDYIWNNTTKTSIITSQKSTSTENGNSSKDPELGDSGDIIETGTVLNQWTATNTEYGVSSGVHTLGSTFAGNSGSVTAVTRDYSNLKKNSETFMFTANAPFYNVTSNNSGKIISIQADNMSCTGQTYQLYQTSSNLINTISLYPHPETSSSTMDIEVLQDDYQYDISFSADKQIL
jgi:N-acetylmuramoyl-L-alanine amidase